MSIYCTIFILGTFKYYGRSTHFTDTYPIHTRYISDTKPVLAQYRLTSINPKVVSDCRYRSITGAYVHARYLADRNPTISVYRSDTGPTLCPILAQHRSSTGMPAGKVFMGLYFSQNVMKFNLVVDNIILNPCAKFGKPR